MLIFRESQTSLALESIFELNATILELDNYGEVAMPFIMNPDIEIPIRVSGVGDEFEFLFRQYYRVKGPSLIPADKRWLPPTDLFETQDALVVVMDIAGIDHREVSVRIEGHILTIRGFRRELAKYSKRHYYLMEIDVGPFERRFHLPHNVDADQIEAHYTDGFLEVVMPKQVSGPIDISNGEEKNA